MDDELSWVIDPTAVKSCAVQECTFSAAASESASKVGPAGQRRSQGIITPSPAVLAARTSHKQHTTPKHRREEGETAKRKAHATFQSPRSSLLSPAPGRRPALRPSSSPALHSHCRKKKLVMMLRRVASTPVPEWLETLLSTRFFLACGAHPASPRNECNMFCLDCRGAPPPAFCYYCRAHRHAGHRVIQIRRSSYHDVVRVSEVEDVLDITGVQTYVINSARVLFLNERPQPRGAGAAAGKAAASPYNCEICGRALLDPFRFCSLGCKLVDTKRRSTGHAAATGEAQPEAAAGGSKNDSAARPQGRRRKGIPHRAPFWS